MFPANNVEVRNTIILVRFSKCCIFRSCIVDRTRIKSLLLLLQYLRIIYIQLV